MIKFTSSTRGAFNDEESDDEPFKDNTWNQYGKLGDTLLGGNSKDNDKSKKQNKLPFEYENGDFGSHNELKTSESFSEHSGFKAYLRWFDGWSIEQYQHDFEKFEF